MLSGAVGGKAASTTFRGKTSTTASTSNGQGKGGGVKATLSVAGVSSRPENAAVVPRGATGHGGHPNSEDVGGEKTPVPHGSVMGRLAPQVLRTYFIYVHTGCRRDRAMLKPFYFGRCWCFD